MSPAVEPFEPVIKLIRAEIVHPSPVNNRRDRTKNLESLVDSIRAQGVLQFPTLRPHPEKVDEYEIVFGERRCRACSELGMPVPAIIRELTDQEAHAMTVTENMEREELTPLEESWGVKTLLDDGMTVEEVADKLGKTARWVARRAKLSNLSESWLEVLSDPENLALQSYTGSHLELIARFDHHIQDTFYSTRVECGHSYETFTLKELQDELDAYLLNMSSAPFKLDDADLYPEAGACTTCIKRTSTQTNLFDEVDEKGKLTDRCIDRLCYGVKTSRHVEAQEAKFREKHPKLLRINNSNGNGFLDNNHPLKEKALKSWDYSNCKKSDPAAVPALVVDGPGAGSIKYIKPCDARKGAEAGKTKSLDEKRVGLEQKRNVLLITNLISLLDKEIASPDHILTLRNDEIICAVLASSCVPQHSIDPDSVDGYKDFTWDEYERMQKRDLGIDDLLVNLMRCVLPKWKITLKGIAQCQKVDLDFAERACRFLKINIDNLKQDAATQLPEPKSWAKLAKAESAEGEATLDDQGPESEEQAPEKPARKKAVKKKAAKKESGKTPEKKGWTNPETDENADQD